MTSTRNGPPPRRASVPSAGIRPRPQRRSIHPGAIVVLAVLLFALLLVLHHFHHGSPKKQAVAVTTTTQPVRLTVATTTCTFVDTTRSTKDYVTEESKPGRRLITDIYYPAIKGSGTSASASLTPAKRLGPFPTIFFAGGYAIDPSSYAALIDVWVADRFVVIAPRFPDASVAAVAAINGGDADEADIPNEPGDLTFVTRRAIAISAGTSAGCPILHGLVDPRELALAGQSDGATTVAMLGFDRGEIPGTTTTYASLRSGLDYRSVAVLSGAAYGSDPYGSSAGAPALLSVNSATDTCNTPTQAVDLYSAIDQPDRWFLAITSADHLTPYEGQDAAAFEVVAKVTGTFFGEEFSGDSPGSAFLRLGNSEPAVAALVQGADLPADLSVDNGDGGLNCYVT